MYIHVQVCKYKRVVYVCGQEEQFRLKQELAELAISINMEAQKGHQQDTDFGT